MGMTSLYPRVAVKPPRIIRTTDTVNAGGTFQTTLDPDAFINEHLIVLNVSAAFPTTAPTAYVEAAAGRLLSNVKVTVTGSQQGELVNMSGVMLRPVGFAYENKPSAVYSLGATTTLALAFEVHYINDEAKQDLLTAINGPANTQIRLECTTADVITTVFTGGAGYVAASATMYADVYSNEQPSHKVAESALYSQTGIARHFQRETPLVATGAQDVYFDLEVDNKTRTIFIAADTGTALSETLISRVALQVAGVTQFDLSWAAARADSARSTSVDLPGMVAITFGDDLEGVLDLGGVRQARVKITTTGAVTARCVQDYTQ